MIIDRELQIVFNPEGVSSFSVGHASSNKSQSVDHVRFGMTSSQLSKMRVYIIQKNDLQAL